jgi:hypothetical protein
MAGPGRGPAAQPRQERDRRVDAVSGLPHGRMAGPGRGPAAQPRQERDRRVDAVSARVCFRGSAAAAFAVGAIPPLPAFLTYTTCAGQVLRARRRKCVQQWNCTGNGASPVFPYSPAGALMFGTFLVHHRGVWEHCWNSRAVRWRNAGGVGHRGLVHVAVKRWNPLTVRALA